MSDTQPLVSCEWLADHLDDDAIRVIEVTSAEDDAQYREGHIPGAAWWFWKDALWHDSDRQFVTPDEVAESLSIIGVTPQTTIVLYGIPFQYGTYAFWVLKMAGHQDIRLLDGGITRWKAEGRPLEQDAPTFEAAYYPVSDANTSSRVGRDNVLEGLNSEGRILLDVRSPEEYEGERVSPPPNFDHGAERKGRIPGARHLFFRELLNEDDTLKSPDQLRRQFARVGIRPDSTEEIVTYCRLSHRATLAWFAMEHVLGLEKVRIYDGSWTEWGSIVGFPIEK